MKFFENNFSDDVGDGLNNSGLLHDAEILEWLRFASVRHEYDYRKRERGIMIIQYFRETGWKRVLVMLIGNVFLGMGISIFKFSCLGNDAFNGMVMALSDCVGIPYARCCVIVSICLFFIELLAGRSFIGAGTIVNTFFSGYIVMFFYNIWLGAFHLPEMLLVKIAVMLIGVIVCSFGISLYQTPDAGVSPYDSLSLILAKKSKKVPYFWCRILTDGICALVCFCTGGLIGIGTLAATFCLGPFVHFFNTHFTEKILEVK